MRLSQRLMRVANLECSRIQLFGLQKQLLLRIK